MYKFYNKNPLDIFTDDCVLRAISMAEGTTWDYTYDKLSDLAQSRGLILNDRNFVLGYLDGNYTRLPITGELIGELVYKYPKNVLLITTRGHIVCSKYGIIYDTFDCRDRKVEYAWIIK